MLEAATTELALEAVYDELIQMFDDIYMIDALTATGIAEKKSGPYLHRDSLSFVYGIYGSHRN